MTSWSPCVTTADLICDVQVSLWNFIKYNVVGGGDSALYGVESASYYLRNGMLNLNVALPLALVASPSLLLWSLQNPGRAPPPPHLISLVCSDTWSWYL